MPVLEKSLRETGMEGLYREMELPLVWTLFGMEQEGIRVDAAALKAYGDELAVGTGGKAVKATSGAFIVGIALEAATQAGQRIAVQIVKAGYKPAD